MRPAESSPFPTGRPKSFRATVHGTVFGGREKLLDGIRDGDQLNLVADPMETDEPGVWVHIETGDLIGHLPPEIATWLAPWMRSGGAVHAVALRVRGRETPSWRRVLLEVRCG